jgi:hypothetical protein
MCCSLPSSAAACHIVLTDAVAHHGNHVYHNVTIWQSLSCPWMLFLMNSAWFMLNVIFHVCLGVHVLQVLNPGQE